MAGFIRLFSFQSRIKFWCSLIEKRSETRHMLIAQTVRCNAGACESRKRGDFSGLSLEIKVVIGAGTPGKEEES